MKLVTTYFTNIVVEAEWFHAISVDIALSSIWTSTRHIAASVRLIATVTIITVATEE